MTMNASLGDALDRIAERAADVRRAFTPGASPVRDDVATDGGPSSFTLDPLSVAAPGDDLFVALDRNGRTAYTRDGSFAVRNGELVSGSGAPVLGFARAGGALEPLRIDPVDAQLGRVRDLRVGADGMLSYARSAIDPRSGARETQRVDVGRVALARFPAGTRLDARDPDVVHAPPGIVPHVGAPGDGSFAAVAPMQRERSRIDIDEGLARLNDAYLAFDALQAAQTARGHLGKTAMDLLK
jgi:flagellar basal body rod protein FlgG